MQTGWVQRARAEIRGCLVSRFDSGAQFAAMALVMFAESHPVGLA